MKAKYLLCFLLIMVLVFTFAACSNTTTTDTTSDDSNGTTSDNSQTSEEPRELRVLSWGGAYDEALAKNIPAFEKEYNCKVTFVNASGADTLVKINNNECDIIITDPIYSMRGERNGLFAEINETNVPNLANIYDIAQMDDYTVIHDVGAYGIAYNPDKVGEVPDSWNDLWEPQYKGKVIIRGFRADSLELMVWKAKQDGGDERNIDPGFKAMGELAQNLNCFVSDHAEAVTLFQTGDVALGVWTDGRVAWAREQDTPVEFSLPKEGGFCMITTMNIVKNSPNIDLAYAYVNMELGVDAQVNMGTDLGYFPMNKQAYAGLASDVSANMAFTPDTIEQAQMADWAYIETVYDEWSERWEKEVVSQAN